MYANGVGVAKNSKQAAVLYRKAAEQGLAEAAAALELLDHEFRRTHVFESL